jgi:hypothetical protein
MNWCYFWLVPANRFLRLADSMDTSQRETPIFFRNLILSRVSLMIFAVLATSGEQSQRCRFHFSVGPVSNNPSNFLNNVSFHKNDNRR